MGDLEALWVGLAERSKEEGLGDGQVGSWPWHVDGLEEEAADDKERVHEYGPYEGLDAHLERCWEPWLVKFQGG